MLDDDENLDILSSLPAELAELILSYLPAKDLHSVSKVCKNWKRISDSDFLWRNLCVKDGVKDETLTSDFFDRTEETTCRWSQLYRTSQSRLKRWKCDSYTKITPPNSFFKYLHGVTLLLGTQDGVTVYGIEGDHLVHVQNLITNVPTTFVTVLDNTLICGNDSFFHVYIQENNMYKQEAVLCPFDHKNDKSVNDNIHKVLVITHDYIWIGIKESFVITCCKVYDRVDKTFTDIFFNDLVTVQHNKHYVSVLSPCAVQIYSEAGNLLCKLDNCAFYTGLAMSSHGIAFLQCQDFCDPEAVYFDLNKETCVIENKLKVYKLSLYEDNLLYLTGQNQFAIVSQKDGETSWITPLTGSKYLRPGKDLFQVICSKFVFVSPSLGRTDMFSLFDLQTGSKMYDTCIKTSTFNIIQLSDTGILYKKEKSTVKLRSYI